MAKVLIIEEDRQFNDEIAQGLKELGYEYIQVYTIDEIFDYICNDDIGVVILDVKMSYDKRIAMMNDETFFNVPVVLTKSPTLGLKKIRNGQRYNIRTQRHFEIIELMARIQAVFGRIKCEQETFSIGDNVVVDLKNKKVEMNGQLVELTSKEFELLEALIINRNVNMSREKILEIVWAGDCDGSSRTVDVHIRKLRKKLNLEDYIITIYKVGYKLKV